MNLSTLNDAISAAKEFLKHAEKLKNESRQNSWGGVTTGQLAATVRRRSMDLTNELANLRQGR